MEGSPHALAPPQEVVAQERPTESDALHLAAACMRRGWLLILRWRRRR